jgi:Cupin-like domain
MADDLLVQLAGRKTVLLWDPSQYELLHLNPLGSAHDRESRINVHALDDCFSNFNDACAFRPELIAGQILHGWPHYVHTDEFSVSVDYWWAFEEMMAIHEAVVTAGRDRTKLEGLIELGSRLFTTRRVELITMRKCMLRDASLDAYAASLEKGDKL